MTKRNRLTQDERNIKVISDILLRRDRQLYDLLSGLQPYQREVYDSPDRFKTILATKRAGKSTTVATSLLASAIENPESDSLYVGLTKHTTQNIMMPIMRDLINKYGIQCNYVYERNAYELYNGSKIFMRGADQNDQEIIKVLGSKRIMTAFDECGHYTKLNLYRAVYEYIMPIMGDLLGSIWLIGTPSEFMTGLFFDITGPLDAKGVPPMTTKGYPITGWTVWNWTWRDNKIIYDNALKAHDELIAKQPDYIDEPGYKRDYLGQWAVDQSSLAFYYSQTKNSITELPRPLSEYTFAVSIDIGDIGCIIVGGWHKYDPSLIIVETIRTEGFYVDDMNTYVKELDKKYHFIDFRVDEGGGGKHIANEMRQRSGITWNAADKVGKYAAIKMMNSDLFTGKIKLFLPDCEPLVKEWSKLIWDEKLKEKRIFEFDKRFEDHLSDGTLYLWRCAKNYWAEPEPELKAQKGSLQEIDEMISKEMTYKPENQSSIYPFGIDVGMRQDGRF